MTSILYFGGFRQDRLPEGDNGLSVLTKAHAPVASLRINLWSAIMSDSLLTRWKRSANQRNAFSNGGDSVSHNRRIIVAGYSMGTHLAVRFVTEFLMKLDERPQVQVYLFAPDPKFRESEMDRQDKASGSRAAFDEACEFWQSQTPGEQFLRHVRSLGCCIGNGSIFISYSKEDEVSEWTDNVALLVQNAELQPGIVLSHASVGKPSTIDDRMKIVLDPERAQSETWIHDQMFANISLIGDGMQ